ncbi:MAG: hypothetical protein ACYDAJ_02835 [Nitrosotalea sp.]
MKTLHLSIISVTAIIIIGIISFVVILPSMQHQTTGNIEIQNIHVQPDTIKVGDTFTVNATLINNSQNPIYVHNDYFCGSQFFVIFDNHVAVDAKPMLCAIADLEGKVNPNGKIITVAPTSLYAFRATKSGITNATVTFSYAENDQVMHGKTISKSFLFTILDK